MQKVLERIKAQQKDMGYTDLIAKSGMNQVDYIRDISLALVKELTEFLDETPWKPWKSFFEQPFNKEKAALEITDMFVFVFVLYISLDPDLPLEEAMERTLTKIEERIKNGYGHKE